MKRQLLTLGLGLCLTACAGADDSPEDGGTETAATTGGTSSTQGTSTSATTGPIPTTVTVSGTSGSSGMEPTTDTGTESGDPPDDTGDTGETGDSSSGGEPVYAFDESDPEDYTQIDRMGMPAISTAVISSKDLYNASTPSDDADGIFVSEIVASLTVLHGALDDDLTGLELVPCSVDDCVAQAAPLVVPDTISIDLTTDAGFPNGRLPADPVMDVTLAVILLDLSVQGQSALSLVGVNPTANDVPFQNAFPFFAEPH